MIRNLLKKVFSGLLVVFGVVTLVFFLFNILPGDPARMMLGQRADMKDVENVRREMGLDRSLSSRYISYLNDLSPLSYCNRKAEPEPVNLDAARYERMLRLLNFNDGSVVIKTPWLGRSYQSGRLVTEIISGAFSGTFILAVASLLIAVSMGVALGMLAALYKNKGVDHFIGFFSAAGMALPSFFAAIIISWLFGFVLAPYTGLQMTGSLYVIDPFTGPHLQLNNLMLPSFTLGIRPLAVIAQLTRSSMLDVLSMDYVRTAKAKGVSRIKVIFRHSLRNALNPVVTAISGWFGSLLAGAVFIEYIFNWKGLGKLTVDALEAYDMPVVMGGVLMVSVFFVFINLLVDVLYGILDPRVRFE